MAFRALQTLLQRQDSDPRLEEESGQDSQNARLFRSLHNDHEAVHEVVF